MFKLNQLIVGIFLFLSSLFSCQQKGEKGRRQFFNEILDVVALLGGEQKRTGIH